MANPTTHDNSIDDNTNATSQKFTSNTKRKNKRNKQRYKNKSQHFNKPTESLQKSPESSIMADDDVTDHQVQQQTTDRDNSTNLNMTTVTTTTPPPPPPPPPPQHAQEANVYKSPRKEAIMRYKQNHDNTFNQLFDIKENLKSKENDDKQSQLQQATGGNQVNSNHNNGNHNISLDLDEKVTLFKYKSLKILELVNQNNANGSLLAHGIFEIFQLHQGDVTYLSCGNNFIYPLLPKIKVFRINSNQFLLPLVNPERYWKIFINSEELNVINNLINVFQRNVQFISLHESENKNAPEPKLQFEFTDSINTKPKELESPPRNIYISNEIPDSPPSAPISPGHIQTTFHLSPQGRVASHQHRQQQGQAFPDTLSQPHLYKKESMQSLNTNIACLDINSKLLLHQPKPKKPLSLNQAYNLRHNQNQNQNYNHNHGHSQKYPAIDEKSESSMDSLLDEYEENIHKSMTIALRPQSRQPSIVSAHHKRLPATHYNRSHYNNQGNLNDDGVAQYYPTETRTQQFPQSNNGHNRSRRSSKSDLYINESGWMEPNLNSQTHNYNNNNYKKIPKSRSTYSINSATTDLYQIYKNIPLRNSEIDRRDEDSKSIKSMSRLPSARTLSIYQSDMNRRRQSAYFASTAKTNLKLNSDVKLNSQEIYRMLSSKPDKPVLKTPMNDNAVKNSGFAARLFGW